MENKNVEERPTKSRQITKNHEKTKTKSKKNIKLVPKDEQHEPPWLLNILLWAFLVT